MKNILVIILSLTLCFSAQCQTSVLDSHFPGGSEAFWAAFQSNFDVPEATVKGRHYGTSLISMLINSDGLPLRSHFLSQIDPDISQAISRSLAKMEDEWKAFPPDTELFLSIRFSFDKDYLKVLKVDKSNLTQEFAEFLYIQKTEMPETINYKKDYSKTLKDAKSAFKNASLNQAKANYSKLIAINPYQMDFYTKRIEIETVIGSKVFACNDVRVLQDILNYQGEVLLHGCK